MKLYQMKVCNSVRNLLTEHTYRYQKLSSSHVCEADVKRYECETLDVIDVKRYVNVTEITIGVIKRNRNLFLKALCM